MAAILHCREHRTGAPFVLTDPSKLNRFQRGARHYPNCLREDHQHGRHHPIRFRLNQFRCQSTEEVRQHFRRPQAVRRHFRDCRFRNLGVPAAVERPEYRCRRAYRNDWFLRLRFQIRPARKVEEVPRRCRRRTSRQHGGPHRIPCQNHSPRRPAREEAQPGQNRRQSGIHLNHHGPWSRRQLQTTWVEGGQSQNRPNPGTSPAHVPYRPRLASLVAVAPPQSRLPRMTFASHRLHCRSLAVWAGVEPPLRSLQKIVHSKRPAHHRHSVRKEEVGPLADPRRRGIRRGSRHRRGLPPEQQGEAAQRPLPDPKPLPRDLSVLRKAAERRRRQIQMQGRADPIPGLRASPLQATSAEELQPGRCQDLPTRGLLPEPRVAALPRCLLARAECGGRPSPPSRKAERWPLAKVR